MYHLLDRVVINFGIDLVPLFPGVREKNVHWGGTVDMTVEESEGKNDFLSSLDREEEVQKQKSGNANGSGGDHEMLTTDKETFHLESQVSKTIIDCKVPDGRSKEGSKWCTMLRIGQKGSNE